MRANGWAHQDLGVTGWWKCGCGGFIELGWLWQSLGLLNFGHCQSSDENKFTIPRSLQNLTWRKFRDIDLLVGVSDVPSVGDHLGVNNSEDGFDTDGITWKDESLQHVHLGSSDLVVSILFIPGSVLVEPVIGLGLSVEVVAEVRWSRWGEPVSWSSRTKEVIDKFFIFSFCVILENSEASRLGA